MALPIFLLVTWLDSSKHLNWRPPKPSKQYCNTFLPTLGLPDIHLARCGVPKTTPFRKLGLTLSGKARCFRIAWWPSASFKRTICNWTLLGTWAFKPNGGGRSCKSFFSMASLYSRPSSWKSMADWYPVTTSKMWTVGLADVSRSSRGNDNQSKLPRGRSGVTMGEVWRMESPSVICFRSSKVKFSASTAMMVSEEQMNAMREYSCLKPIYQTVLLLPDIFTSSCQTVLLFWILGHWIMFHVQPFHIFAFYFVLCCGLVDFLKSSFFCENYTGAQGPPLQKKYIKTT